MTLRRVIAMATAAEVSLAGALLGLAGLAGLWNPWFDLTRQFAPWWLALSVLGLCLTLASMSRSATRRYVLVLAWIGIITNGVAVAPEVLRASAALAGVSGRADTQLKVLSFNVWGDNFEPHQTIDVIVASGADIVTLQEAHGLPEAEQARLARTYPYKTICQPGDCDMVIFSRRPVTTGWFLLPPPGHAPIEILGARTSDRQGRPVQVVTTHYFWPFPPDNQNRQRRVLALVLRRFAREDVILTGDFNQDPWSATMQAQDVAFKPLQRRTLGLFTWPANLAFVHWRTLFPVLALDHVYASPVWHTLEAKRLPRVGAEHYGIIVTLAR